MQEIEMSRVPWPKHMFSVINEPIELKDYSKKILVLIPSKDRNDLLLQCIDSIKTHTDDRLDVSVVIIDTGSSEKTLQEIEEYIVEGDGILPVYVKKHGFYNFAKNNNQAFDEMNGASYDYVVFCNNDVKFLNDIFSRMLQVYETKKNVGTVGARLHFKDGKIQHIGAFCNMVNGKAQPGHYGFEKVITGAILEGSQAVPANTCALMMMDAKLFSQFKFNETYNECFEDVQLNLQVVMSGKVNYCSLDAVAFHFESQTRNLDENKQKKQNEDLNKLSNFVLSNRANQQLKEICFE